jgi:site-specific DNA recombinase
MKSEALLTGRIYDDRGNRMTPSHTRKGNVRYRYYLSSAALQGTAERAGSVHRVPATAVEALVIKSVREYLRPSPSIDDRDLITTRIARVEVQAKQLVIRMTGEPSASTNRRKTCTRNVLRIPWQRTPPTRRREILLPEGMPSQHARPIRSETRATLVAAIARGRRWLDQLTIDTSINTDRIAEREGCSVRKVNMTISLAFLAPDLIKAAIDGRLPHGMGVARLTDLPAEWSRQPDAWLSVALTQHSNRVSNNASLGSRETRFCGAETKASKRSQQFNRQIAETKCVHKSPPVRGDSH